MGSFGGKRVCIRLGCALTRDLGYRIMCLRAITYVQFHQDKHRCKVDHNPCRTPSNGVQNLRI
jgi:hypothetical protein